MDEPIRIFADQAADGLRLDAVLAGLLPEFSRNTFQRLAEEGRICVNGQKAAKSRKVRAGDLLEVRIPPPADAEALPENIPLDIIYEDEWLLVVNKPKGMVVHPAPGNPSGTLVNALLYHCAGQLSGIGGVLRPGIVHRIDKDTSGLLAVAKTDPAHQGLAAQIAGHHFLREYRAVAYGGFREDHGTVNAPIGRDSRDRKRMAVVGSGGKPAVTHYEVLEQFPHFSFLRLRLETGRTHQIRVHLAHTGHPLAGDPVYGPKKILTQLNGQCLHAKVLGFQHPVTGQPMRFESELPEWFQIFLHSLRDFRP